MLSFLCLLAVGSGAKYLSVTHFPFLENGFVSVSLGLVMLQGQTTAKSQWVYNTAYLLLTFHVRFGLAWDRVHCGNSGTQAVEGAS